ncbi:lipopolysaccharide biosynthesis protein [Kocuria sp. LHG3120]|uniref:lipopolysaccharide biosynthesis protein n=1 Tax=Kocuria sp. LHG3120 TaxID=2804590 RepID=UPI003CE6DD1B
MIRQFSWMFLGRIAAALLQFAGFALLVNWVAPAEFGIIASVLGTSAVIIAFLDFGISTHVLKTWALGSRGVEVKSALQLNNHITLGFGVLSSLIVIILALSWNPFFWFLLPLVFWAAGEKNADTWLCVAISAGRAEYNTFNLVGRRLLSLVIMALLMSVTDNGTLSYSLGVAFGAIASVFYAHRVVWPIVSRNMSGGFVSNREILRMARPFWVHSFATQVRNLDTLIVAMVASPLVAGFYGVASKLSGPLRMVPTSIAPVLIPVVVKEGITRRLAGLLLGILAALTIFYVALAATAIYWVPFLFGSSYEPALTAVQITCVGLSLGATASLLGACLQATGDQRYVAQTSVLASVVCIPAIIFGTFFAGSAGAAVGMISSFAIQSLLFTKLCVSRWRQNGH